MKKLKVLFCISILWFSASVLHPVPVDAELGSPSTGNWETVFEQAFSLNSFDQWQNFISENYIQMRTLWEEKMDAEISSIVSSVTESDVVHSTDVYRDYILKYLQAQKDSLLRDWETDSEQQISEERNMFLGKLSGDYVSRSDASIPGTGQDYFSQLQIWGTNFQDTLNLGLSEFQNGLAKIEQSYSELLEKLQKTDEEIAENEYKIRAYEGMVWDNVKGLVGNMAAQLISNTLLHEKDAQGNSLVTLRKSLSTADENISELLSMDKIAINNNYSQKFICTDMNSLDSCTAKITIDGGICQGPSEKTVKITEIESTVRPNYDDGVSRVFQSSEITGPTVTGWSGGTDILGNGIGTPVQSERNYILHYNTYQTYRDRLNGPGELMYEFISKMYSELKKPPEERSLTAAAEAVNLYLAEQKKETDKMAAFWESKIYTDINLGTDSTYRFVYNTFKEADYFRHSFVKDIEILYRLQENLRKLDVFSSGSVTLAYGFSEQNMDAVRGNMPGIYDSSIQPLYADSVMMPYLRANNLKTYSFAEKDTAVLENSMELSSVMERIKSSLKMIHPADNIEIDYIDPQMNLHASSVNLFSDWYVAGHDKVGGNLRTDGLNYRRYRTNFLIDGFAEAGGFDYRQDSEENIWVEIKYRIRDKNAEANWIQWANFQTDVNSQTVLWGSQLNAVQNWTVQSANFRNRASLWNQEKQSLQNEIQNNYNKSMEDLMNEKSAWLADMDSVRSKAVSGDFSADVPSVPLLSYENRISTIRDKTAGFENMQTPDFSSFENFSSVLDDTMNGFLNLLTAKSITDSALSTSSSALNSMAAMLSSQRTMTDAYEVPPENRKEYYDAVKNFSAGGICAGDGFEKNRQICEGIYNGPFFKRQYAGVEVRDGQIEVTVMEKTGRVFLKEGGDAKDQDDYIQETVKKTYYINTPGEAKIADMSSLGSVFKGSWSSKTEGWQNTERKEFGSDLAKYWQYWTDKPQQNLEETAETGSVQEQKKTLLSSVYDEVSKNSSIYLNHFYTNTGTAEKPVYSYNKEGLFSKMAALMSSRESENSQHFSNLARDNAKQEASKAEMLESLATAVVTGGLSQRNLSSWLKDRMTQAVKGKWAQTAADAMCPGDSAKAKEPCQASEIAMALLNAKVDKDTRKKAEKQAFRNAFSAGSIISPAFGEMLNSVRDIPVLKEIVKPTVSLVSNLNAEAAYGVGRVVENIIPEGRLVFGNEYKNWQNHIQRSANAAADSFKSRDLQRDLNAGKTDYRNEVKGMIKEELFKYFANLISPSFPGIRNNDIIKFMKYDQNRRDSAEKERSAERRRQEIAAQTAAAAVLTFVPGAQGAAGAVFSGIVSALESVPVLGNLVTGMKWIIQGAAEYMAEAGSYLQSSIGIAASESAGAGAAGTAANSLTAQALQNYSSASILTSGLSAAADGNSEGVIAAAVNGLLLSFTGPAGGFAGHVSYTPPEKTDLLTGLLNKIDGASKPTSGWGGGFNFGGSIFNAGLTFTPGSGTSVDLGFSNGGQWNQSMFGNISYNINSGHTNGSIGLGQEYGTNLSANFSTDEAPSYTLSFGCDMQGDKGKTGTNCGGGGANKYGLGGSLTLTENGIDAGIDLLGNSFANSSYDRESGTWSDPEFDESWAYNVQQMSSQDLADEEINASARKTAFDEHYKKLLENDPSIAERLQAFLDGRKPDEDEYTALQNFYQDNRELAAQNGFNLPTDNKNS
ncbi:MAG TPA: TIGR04388 family protein, partial [Leptospiraceae bacterium]|nr:TIGR04388 family protein [Leptospiraceae bacterium]